MKFKIVEDLDTYYRIEVVNDRRRITGGLFRGLNDLVNQLYDDNDPYYNNINDPLSELESLTYFPDDFTRSDAIFAYTEVKYEELKDIILELQDNLWDIGWDLIIKKIKRPENIVYEDDEQIAYVKESLTEMAMDRADAIDRCMNLGEKFIEHFDKVMKNPKSNSRSHWMIEMQSWFNQVDKITLKSTKKRLMFTNLMDWFFTVGSSPEEYLDSNIEEYNDFIIELYRCKDVKKAFETILEK